MVSINRVEIWAKLKLCRKKLVGCRICKLKISVLTASILSLNELAQTVKLSVVFWVSSKKVFDEKNWFENKIVPSGQVKLNASGQNWLRRYYNIIRYLRRSLVPWIEITTRCPIEEHIKINKKMQIRCMIRCVRNEVWYSTWKPIEKTTLMYRSLNLYCYFWLWLSSFRFSVFAQKSHVVGTWTHSPDNYAKINWDTSEIRRQSCW